MLNRLEGVKALAYCGIMCAICTLFVICAMYIPFSTICVLIAIPLCTTFVALKVDYKYLLIYSLSSTLISFLDPLNALFIMIPSIITGITMGILLKKYIQGYYTIFITSFVLIILQIFAQYLIKGLFEQDMMLTFGKLLGFSETKFQYMYLLFLFLISLAQATLTYEICSNELKKLSYTFNEKKDQFIVIFSITTLLLFASLGLYFVSIAISYLFVGFTFYFMVVLAYYNFQFYLRRIILTIQLPLYSLSMIMLFVLYPYFTPLTYLYVTLGFVISTIIVSLTIITFQKFIKKGKINETLFDKLI